MAKTILSCISKFLFLKAQRRNINDWKKMSEDLKAKHAAEVVKERVDDEMEMSDDDDDDEDGKNTETSTLPPPTKKYALVSQTMLYSPWKNWRIIFSDLKVI